jgi:putative membrane-bound dehydrogenase-like protein
LAAVVFLPSCSRKGPAALKPVDALNSFRLSEDFRVELFAAEPQVVDPVDLVFDEQGRAFAVEMLDLPDNPPPGKPARGRIRLLEDTDGDGRADRSVIFAENVLQASGLMPWKGGLIVPAAPEILYLKDTNGDGRADLREVWFTGFWQGNPEAQITNPRLAIDNWIYFSNTGNEGLIRSPRHPNHPPVQVRGADFRYHPIRGIFEAASGAAQFGSTFDEWGNRFITQNTIHLRHVVIPMHYLRRAPLMESPAVVHDVYGNYERKMFPLTAPQHWRVERTRLRQQRYDELKTGRVEHASGYITGAAGSTVYTGDAWPESYRGSIFTGDVSANLVRRDTVNRDGVTFLARPAKEGVEFLASTDPWFRPTSFANAPDGNLYMVDMQREFIETPLSVPEELRKSMDSYSGDTLGRIYRIVSKQPSIRRALKVDLSSAQLVRLLEHRNGWHRATAQRLLVERQEKATAQALRELARKAATPEARLRALWTLEGIGALIPDDLVVALDDPVPQVREHAVRLSESVKVSPALEKKLLSSRNDADIRVRYQLAYTLGELRSPAAIQALAGIAMNDGSNPWIRTAVLSSVASAPGAFYARIAPNSSPELTRGLAALVGARQQPGEIRAFVAELIRQKQRETGWFGLARGLRLAGARSLVVPGIEPALQRSLESGSAAEQDAVWEVARFLELRALVDRAAKEAGSPSTPVGARVRAVEALRGAPYPRAAAVLDSVLASNPPVELQVASVLAYSSFDEPGVATALLNHWARYSPEARAKAVAALQAKQDRVEVLLRALESGQIEASAVDVSSRNRLLESNAVGVADRARRIFQHAAGDRAKVVAAYRDVVSLSGDVERGKLAFAEHCGRCHMARRQGGRVGPDLSGINNKTREELLEAILNPSAAIESRFVNYMVTLRDGRMYDGVLAAETPGAITLRGGAEEDVVLLRAGIAEIRASTISLMPEDLEKAMSKQTLADVIAYLRGGL